MLSKINQAKRNQMMLKFRNTHALLKNYRPFTDYVWMNRLDRFKGLDVGSDYARDKSAAVFAYHIAEVRFQNIMINSLIMFKINNKIKIHCLLGT